MYIIVVFGFVGSFSLRWVCIGSHGECAVEKVYSRPSIIIIAYTDTVAVDYGGKHVFWGNLSLELLGSTNIHTFITRAYQWLQLQGVSKKEEEDG